MIQAFGNKIEQKKRFTTGGLKQIGNSTGE